jgi:hypothetical protein
MRWLTLAALPYAIVPAIAGVLAGPAFLAWVLTSGQWRTCIPDGDLALGASIAWIGSATRPDSPGVRESTLRSEGIRGI